LLADEERILNNRKRTLVTFFVLLTFFSVIALPAVCFGRAGGGGGYSRGGGGGGGFSGGSFRGGGSSFGSSRHGGRGTRIPLPIIILIVLVIIAVKIASEYQAKGRRRNLDLSQRKRLGSNVLGHVKATDPSFDEEKFLQSFKIAFVNIQHAWQAQDLSTVQHFLTDGVCEKFSLQFVQQQAEGYREHLDRIEIRDAQFAHFDANSVFEVLTVAVEASMVDYRISPETGQRISGNTDSKSFTEYWSFIRRRGTQSRQSFGGGSLLEGQCPNCGADVEMNQFGKCQSCDILVKSGSYDWVLSEITQAVEWRTGESSVQSVAEQYRQKFDPEFSIQHVEDRAAVIFYRRIAVGYENSVAPLKKMATEKLCESIESNLAPGLQFHGDCSVGSVEFMGALGDDSHHYCVVEVRWCARQFSKQSSGELHAVGSMRNYRSLMILGRQAAVKTRASESLRSAHCPACGAPEGDLVSHACQYCGEITNTGRYDWVLTEFHQSTVTEGAGQWISRLAQVKEVAPVQAVSPSRERSNVSRADGLTWIIKMMAEDAQIDAAERKAIQHIATKNRIAEPVVEQWIEEALAGTLEAPKILDRNMKKHVMNQMIDMAVADGRVDEDEKAMLVEVAERIGLSWYDVNMVVKKRLFENGRSNTGR
jgi:uncharacterized tellurite resistance protein B-like protein